MSRISNSSFKVNSSLEQIVAVSGDVEVVATSELPINLTQVNGDSVVLGQNVMLNSLPVAISSDQTDLLTDVSKFGGISVNLGEQVMTDSMPVVIASDQTAIPVTLSGSSVNSGSEGNLDNGTTVASGDFSSEVETDGKKNLTITGTTTDISSNPIEIHVNHTSLGTKYKYQYDIYPDSNCNFS